MVMSATMSHSFLRQQKEALVRQHATCTTAGIGSCGQRLRLVSHALQLPAATRAVQGCGRPLPNQTAASCMQQCNAG